MHRRLKQHLPGYQVYLTGQSHLNSAEDLEKVVVIPARLFPLGAGADFGQLVVLQEVEGDVAQHPEVLGGVAFAYPAFVFPECDVQYPVQ